MDTIKGEATDIDLGLSLQDNISQNTRRPAGHGPAQRAVACIDVQVGKARRTDQRRSVRRHRPEAAPEGGLANRSAVGEEVGDGVLERRAAGRIEPRVVARNLGRATDADAVAQAG